MRTSSALCVVAMLVVGVGHARAQDTAKAPQLGPSHAAWVEIGGGRLYFPGTGEAISALVAVVYTHREWITSVEGQYASIPLHHDASVQSDEYQVTGAVALVGRRSAAHRVLASMSAGPALMKRERVSEPSPCSTICKIKRGSALAPAVVFDASVRANLWVYGSGAHVRVMVGPRSTSIGFAFTGGFGWWGT